MRAISARRLRRTAERTARKQANNVWVGVLGDGAGTIQVPGFPDLRYVRPVGNNLPFPVRRGNVPDLEGLRVWVGIDPYSRMRVLRILGLSDPGGVTAGVEAHGWTHIENGIDPTWITTKQVVDCLVFPTSAMTVAINPGWWIVGGQAVHVAYQTLDLTANIPGSGALYTLIRIGGDGIADTQDGAAVGSYADLADDDVPEAELDYTALAAVRLYYGQTALSRLYTNPDVIDLRMRGGGAGTFLSDHDHSGDTGDGGPFPLVNLTSEVGTASANEGYIPIADGAGGIDWGLNDPGEAGGVDIGARVYNDAAISIGNGGAATSLTFNSERWDTDGLHSTSVNTSRLTCTRAGKYYIFGNVEFAADNDGRRILAINFNNTLDIASTALSPNSATLVPRLNVSCVYPLEVGEYVELRVYQDSGAALDVLATANRSPEFGMQLVSTLGNSEVGGSGAANQIAVFSGTTSLTSDDNLSWDGTTLTIGDGTAGRDYILAINGETSDLNLTYMEDEGYLKIDQEIRAASTLYRRYYHMPLSSADPGASGATWTAPSANTLGGWRLDAAGELLYLQADVHADWDAASDLTVEVKFEVNVDNTGGGAGDTVDLKLVCYYKGDAETACKSQTVEVATVVGQSAQYKRFTANFTIDYDYASNVVEAGDVISFILNLETDSSEVDDIILNDASIHYNTTHMGIEAGDT